MNRFQSPNTNIEDYTGVLTVEIRGDRSGGVVRSEVRHKETGEPIEPPDVIEVGQNMCVVLAMLTGDLLRLAKLPEDKITALLDRAYEAVTGDLGTPGGYL